ncbi:MAG TPA: family 3 encapsulin nanocompartment shell protein [Streptosporangiaceae bacterium]|nr:family 3 encapsulin nanocompartment shell protein [Streptosporangiaceae bacterium]
MVTATVPGTKATTAVSPGTAFAAAFVTDGDRAEVTYDYTITDAHKPDRPKPRLTVRGLLKRRRAESEVTSFWCEHGPSTDQAAAVAESGLRREAAFQTAVAQASVYPVQAWVQIPGELAKDPGGLAEYIDHRLLVRLATAENQALTIGPHGLLHHQGIARLPYDGDFADGMLAALDEVEQVGSTAHAVIINPADFYRRLAGRGSLLTDLAANGTLISRTRMIPVGQALAGDFAEAVRLLDAGRSVIRVAEPPPGTFAEPGLAVCGEVYEGLVVHLPTNLFLAVPAERADTRTD